MKIIAMLHVLLGIGSILLSVFINRNTVSDSGDRNFASGLLPLSIAIMLVLIGIFLFLVARGLWKARPWARMLTLTITGLILLINLVSVSVGNFTIYGLSILPVFLVMSGYLYINKTAKSAFWKDNTIERWDSRLE